MARSDAKFPEIVEDVAKAIDSGAIKPGDKIPRLEDLMEKYKVNRATAVKAQWILQEKGYTRSTGRGTYVRATREDRLLDRLRDVLNEMEEAGMDPQMMQLVDIPVIRTTAGHVEWNREFECWTREGVEEAMGE